MRPIEMNVILEKKKIRYEYKYESECANKNCRKDV